MAYLVASCPQKYLHKALDKSLKVWYSGVILLTCGEPTMIMRLTTSAKKLSKLITSASYGIGGKSGAALHCDLKDGIMSITSRAKGCEVDTYTKSNGFDKDAEGTFKMPAYLVKKFLNLKSNDICNFVLDDGVTVHAPMLINDSDEVELLVNKYGGIEISRGDMKMNCNRFSLDDWIPLEFDDTAKIAMRFTMSKKVLKHALSVCAPSMAKTDIRYYLNAMQITRVGNALKFISTDGHRLTMHTESEVEKLKTSSKDRKCLVSNVFVKSLIKVLGKDDGEVTITIDEGNEIVKVVVDGETVLMGHGIDGKIPDFVGVLEEKTDVTVKANRVELLAMCKKVYASYKKHAPRFTFRKGELELWTGDKGLTETMPVKYSGSEFAVGYNLEYLMDALKTMSAENVDLLIRSKDNVLFPTDSESKNTERLIMPARW